MTKTDDNELSELLDEIKDSLHPKIQRKKIRVLIFGPEKKTNKPSALLRQYIIKKCRKDEYTVVIAEHKKIIQLYEKIFGPANDLCNMEYHLVKDIVDGVVIIPDSAGSFIELGMFTLNDNLHSKILVLFNKEHNKDMASNFIGLGAKTAYDNGSARTKVLDYGNKKAAWEEVSGFLSFRKGKKYWKAVNS